MASSIAARSLKSASEVLGNLLNASFRLQRVDAINTYSQNFPQTLAEAEAEQVIAEMTDAAEIIFEVRRRLKVYSKDSTKIQLCGKKCKDVCDDWCKLLGCCGGSP